ncbi:serine/threonine-protein phosphatase 7 long form homolog [Rhododendron vialii]|uniref:serine/threonine-protein phosphatase 7 long form homolog n=1 Tax=Rhododendron vialii TaxID=182163 RepID=UPI00265F5123|nr:serine/threonine-protein phosphatase 7 long form homolog [Rhododendron vialii]
MVLQEGLIDESLLTYQQSHRSHSIWANNGEPPVDSKPLKVRQIKARLKKLDPPSPPVLQLIRQAGFGGVIDISFISLDLGLMTALLERWQPETHSFHLRTGEWSVTLQDVEVLLGLPVDGEPIIGTTNEDWGPLCQRLLGIEPVNKVDRKGGKVKMSWLREHFNGHLVAGYTEENVQQQARGYILQLIGGVLMSDHSGSQVHLAYLTLLEDLTIVRGWGSACLSNLYHYLCHGCKSGKDNVGGAFILLQLWAWERFPFIAPRRLGTRQRPPGSPLGARWDDHFHSLDLSTHVVGYYRHYFDMQRPDEVIWRPYSDELIASLPPSCRAGRAIWMAKVPLLNFPMVQMHMTDRVMRQFGRRQTIPAHCNCRQPPHGKDWKAGQKDYRQDHHAELEMWNHRLEHIVPTGEPDSHEYAYPANDPHVTWYERITVQYISRLGGGADKAIRLFERLMTVQTMEDIGLDELRSIGEEGVGAMLYLEKWLRKRPPIEPNQPQAEGVNVAEKVDLLQDPAIEVDNAVAQKPVDPFIHNDAIPDTVDVGTTSAPQDADGGSVSSSFTAHIGSVPSYPFTPMFQSTSPLPVHTDMSFDPQEWFDCPLQNVGGLDTTFLGRSVLKRKETLDGNDGGSSDAPPNPQLGDDLVGTGGHPTVEGDAEVPVKLDVQGKQGEGDGVVTQAHVVEQEVQEEQDGTPPFVPRRSQHQPHPAACGTGSHKLLHYSKRRKDM